MNSDWTRGCADERLLQVVGGYDGKSHHSSFYLKVLADTTGKYRLLCITCNHLEYKRRRTTNAKVQAQRRTLLKKLGGKCASPGCCWLESDDTLGCRDLRVLQIDHINGDGAQDRLKSGGKGIKVLRRALKDTTGRYQILCPNCNTIKSLENHEYVPLPLRTLAVGAA
jgi:hypothetical protein